MRRPSNPPLALQAALLKGQAGTPTVARPATPECEDEAKRSAKRTRTDGGH